MKQFDVSLEFERADKKYPTSTHTIYHTITAEDRSQLEEKAKEEAWFENFMMFDFVYELRDVRIYESEIDEDGSSNRALEGRVADYDRPSRPLLTRFIPQTGQDEHGT